MGAAMGAAMRNGNLSFLAMACESGSTVGSRGSRVGDRGSRVAGRGGSGTTSNRSIALPQAVRGKSAPYTLLAIGESVAASTREKPDAKNNPRSSQGAAQLVRCGSFAAECPNCLRAFRKVYRRITVNRSGETRTVPLGIR